LGNVRTRVRQDPLQGDRWQAQKQGIPGDPSLWVDVGDAKLTQHEAEQLLTDLGDAADE
jgi:hypothetical protein